MAASIAEEVFASQLSQLEEDYEQIGIYTDVLYPVHEIPSGNLR